jgi:hypothetical protein
MLNFNTNYQVKYQFSKDLIKLGAKNKSILERLFVCDCRECNKVIAFPNTKGK